MKLEFGGCLTQSSARGWTLWRLESRGRKCGPTVLNIRASSRQKPVTNVTDQGDWPAPKHFLFSQPSSFPSDLSISQDGQLAGCRKIPLLRNSLLMGVAQRHRGWLPQAFHPQVFTSRLGGFIVRDSTGEKKGLRKWVIPLSRLRQGTCRCLYGK